MPINGYTVGRDISLTVVTGSGPVRFKAITGFSSKPDTAEQKVKKIDGVTDHLQFFDGWTGRFTVERQDSTADDYFSQLEQDYYDGKSNAPVTITETITEQNGSVSQYRYLKVLLKYDDAGEYRGDGSVKQTISFLASRRVKVS